MTSPRKKIIIIHKDKNSDISLLNLNAEEMEKVVREVLQMEKEDPLLVFSSEKGLGFEEAWAEIEGRF